MAASCTTPDKQSMYTQFQLLVILFRFGVYKYQDCLHNVYENVESNRGNILGCKRVKCVTVEMDHHGWRDRKSDIYFILM